MFTPAVGSFFFEKRADFHIYAFPKFGFMYHSLFYSVFWSMWIHIQRLRNSRSTVQVNRPTALLIMRY